MKKIFVTGGAGYIGSCTCKMLSDFGYFPIVYDNMSFGHKEFVKWGPLIEGDIKDFPKLNLAIKKFKPNAVIHLAALASVNESFSKREKYYKTNVSGTINLIRAMLENNINKIILSSSCSIYGMSAEAKIKEEHAKNPINPYGLTKMLCEQALSEISRKHDVQFISMRYFNAAGADYEMLSGERHRNETHIIPLAIKASLEENRIFSINGNDHDTPDGTALRDYVHVNDLAWAHFLALNKLLNNEYISTTFNLGSGKGTSVLKLIEAINNIVEKPISTVIKKRRRGDPASLVADITKARSELGWIPRHSAIDNIIETAYKWHRLENRRQQ